MTKHYHRAVCLILLFLNTICYAKTTSITVTYTTVSLVNSHFSFIASVTNNDASVNYKWNFGDGNVTNWTSEDIANHTFSVTGIYTVSVTARNSSGDSATFTRIISALVYPQAGVADFTFSPSIVYAGASVQFTNTTINPGGPSTATHWDLGDGTNLMNTENPIHIYANPGIYSVRLTAGNDTTVKTFRVLSSGPHASFTIPSQPLCRGDIPFTDQSFSNTGAIVNWYWTFGDNSSVSTIQNPVHNYYYPTNYTVTLIVQDASGQKDTAIQYIQIQYPVMPDFTYSPATIYTGDTIQLTDHSSPICDTPRSWEWSVKGPIGVYSFFWHQYGSMPPPFVLSAAGNYKFTEWVNGDTALKTLTVYPGGNKSLCSGGTVTLNTTTTATMYQWQESTDNGNSYHDIQNDTHFSGAITNALTISNAPSSWYGNIYQCRADNISIAKYKLQFVNQYNGTGAWENTANWSCQMLPDEFTDVIIASGTITVNSNTTCRSLKVQAGANLIVAPGVTLIVLH